MAILEYGRRREGTRPGKESRLEQYYRVWCERVPTSPQTAGWICRPFHEQPTVYDTTEEAYPDLSNLKRELERAQRERDKANLDRDGGKLERDQAYLERDQAVLEIRAEYQQEQKVRENEANCEQLKSEIEKIQRRQREFAIKKEKGTRTTERAAAGSRPESWKEVDEVARSNGRFNLG